MVWVDSPLSSVEHINVIATSSKIGLRHNAFLAYIVTIPGSGGMSSESVASGGRTRGEGRLVNVLALESVFSLYAIIDISHPELS